MNILGLDEFVQPVVGYKFPWWHCKFLRNYFSSRASTAIINNICTYIYIYMYDVLYTNMLVHLLPLP